MKLTRLATLTLTLALSAFAAEPEPPIVTPGTQNHLPPSDAIVLFDGKDFSKWQSMNGGGEPKWEIVDGAMQVTKTGSIRTKEEFGDVQLHVEWASPAKVEGSDQGRGNSGVYLMGRYEIQVLDSYQNKTYPNGQAASFYGHNAPLVNVSRKPGEWQAYDIIFRAPKKSADGAITPGSFTVLHNGVLVQDHVPIKGEATTAAAFKNIAEKGPIILQDHSNPVRFRNIWLRKL
ncbi:MAG: 3-keto-disaccharide hydrolase [Limisphaerales bacterium]